MITTTRIANAPTVTPTLDYQLQGVVFPKLHLNNMINTNTISQSKIEIVLSSRVGRKTWPA